MLNRFKKLGVIQQLPKGQFRFTAKFTQNLKEALDKYQVCKHSFEDWLCLGSSEAFGRTIYPNTFTAQDIQDVTNLIISAAEQVSEEVTQTA